MAHLRRHQEAAHKTVSNGRKVQRLVEDSSGNLVLRPKPAKEKKNPKEKKVLSSKASSSKSTKDLSSPASTVQQEETTVPLIAVSESEHVVAMSVSDLQISNQHIDPYNLQVGFSYYYKSLLMVCSLVIFIIFLYLYRLHMMALAMLMLKPN